MQKKQPWLASCIRRLPQRALTFQNTLLLDLTPPLTDSPFLPRRENKAASITLSGNLRQQQLVDDYSPFIYYPKHPCCFPFIVFPLVRLWFLSLPQLALRCSVFQFQQKVIVFPNIEGKYYRGSKVPPNSSRFTSSLAKNLIVMNLRANRLL